MIRAYRGRHEGNLGGEYAHGSGKLCGTMDLEGLPWRQRHLRCVPRRARTPRGVVGVHRVIRRKLPWRIAMNAQAMVSVECKQHVRLYRQYDIVSNLGGEPFALCDHHVRLHPIPMRCMLLRVAPTTDHNCKECRAAVISTA